MMNGAVAAKKDSTSLFELVYKNRLSVSWRFKSANNDEFFDTYNPYIFRQSIFHSNMSFFI